MGKQRDGKAQLFYWLLFTDHVRETGEIWGKWNIIIVITEMNVQLSRPIISFW